MGGGGGQGGRVDIGGSRSLLSQDPAEEEYLMHPLSCLEVAPPLPGCLVSTHVDLCRAWKPGRRFGTQARH